MPSESTILEVRADEVQVGDEFLFRLDGYSWAPRWSAINAIEVVDPPPNPDWSSCTALWGDGWFGALYLSGDSTLLVRRPAPSPSETAEGWDGTLARPNQPTHGVVSLVTARRHETCAQCRGPILPRQRHALLVDDAACDRYCPMCAVREGLAEPNADAAQSAGAQEDEAQQLRALVDELRVEAEEQRARDAAGYWKSFRSKGGHVVVLTQNGKTRDVLPVGSAEEAAETAERLNAERAAGAQEETPAPASETNGDNA